MAVWRLHTKTGNKDERIATFCLAQGIIALGWSLIDTPDEERDCIKTFEQYLKYAEAYTKENSAYQNGINSVKRMYYQMKPGDLIWIRDEGLYYLGRVGEGSEWQFNSGKEAKKYDMANQRTNIEWLEKPFDESEVPGAVTTAFISRRTLQPINKNGVREFSEIIYNRFAGRHIYDTEWQINQDSFYSLISPTDCEDLLCMWLYEKYGYICIPSTNKTSTQKYECVLLDPKTEKRIYIQVKNGHESLNAKDYTKLSEIGEVWLLTTRGQVINPDNLPNIKAADPKALYAFATENGKTVPPAIKKWISPDKN